MMNSTTTIALSFGEMVSIIVTLVVMIMAIITITIRFLGKFEKERTLTETSISTLKAEITSTINTKEALLQAGIKENALAIRKNETAIVELKDFFRNELDKKTDAISSGLKNIENLFHALSQNLAAKFVERTEIDAKFERQDQRITVVEQGNMKMIAQNDQMLGLLAQIRIDSREGRE